jgi:hypothetical protein
MYMVTESHTGHIVQSRPTLTSFLIDEATNNGVKMKRRERRGEGSSHRVAGRVGIEAVLSVESHDKRLI